ncbi:MAG: hypothetical protein PHT77_05610 [Bacteroidales bacterium]|nr:hypothetical protein [Bacteroidales bacterium]
MAEFVAGAERKEMEEEARAYEESEDREKGVKQYSKPIGPSRREETVSSRGVEQYSHSAGPSREDYEENQRHEESERKKKERRAEFEAERERQREEKAEREEAEKNRKFKAEQEKWNLEQKQRYADEKYQKEQEEILKKKKLPSFQERVGKSVSNVASKIDVDYFGGGKKTEAQQKAIDKNRQWLPEKKGGLNIPSFGGSAPSFGGGSTPRRTKKGKKGRSSASIGKAFSTGIGMSGMGLQPTMPRMVIAQPKFAVTPPRMPQPQKIRPTTPSFPKMAFSPPKYGESAFGKAKLGKGGTPRSVGDINLGMDSPFGKKKENPLHPKKKKGGLW